MCQTGDRHQAEDSASKIEALRERLLLEAASFCNLGFVMERPARLLHFICSSLRRRLLPLLTLLVRSGQRALPASLSPVPGLFICRWKLSHQLEPSIIHYFVDAFCRLTALLFSSTSGATAQIAQWKGSRVPVRSEKMELLERAIELDSEWHEPA